MIDGMVRLGFPLRQTRLSKSLSRECPSSFLRPTSLPGWAAHARADFAPSIGTLIEWKVASSVDKKIAGRFTMAKGLPMSGPDSLPFVWISGKKAASGPFGPPLILPAVLASG